ncbi:MAG: hypothetical protein LBK52_02505 [Deltaproteobacteria bacterium]|jgi:hypothetical protein|nr:hypothetical protein [Deltaproteobacteria bacterium]
MVWAAGTAFSAGAWLEDRLGIRDWPLELIAGAAALAVLAAVCFLVFRKKSPAAGRKWAAGPAPEAGVRPERLAEGNLSLDLPKTIFPSQWLGRLDPKWAAGFLEQAAREARASFFRVLGTDLKSNRIPGEASLKAASQAAGSCLRQYLASPELLNEVSGGRELSPNDLSLLGLHLDELLLPFQMTPPEILNGEVRPGVLGFLALLGALAGNLAGGFLSRLLGLPAEAGLFLGSALGAGTIVFLALFLAQNESARRWLLAAAGGLAFFEAVTVILKGAFLPSLLLFGKRSLFKRIVLGLGLIGLLFLVKGQKIFDVRHWQEAVLERCRRYLSFSLPLAAVLMFRLPEAASGGFPADSKISEDRALAAEAAGLVRRLRASPELEKNPVFGELVRKLNNRGYDTEPLPQSDEPRSLTWDDSLSLSYEPFGLIENGQRVTIETEPVFQDGQVVRKGLAVPQ